MCPISSPVFDHSPCLQMVLGLGQQCCAKQNMPTGYLQGFTCPCSSIVILKASMQHPSPRPSYGQVPKKDTVLTRDVAWTGPANRKQILGPPQMGNISHQEIVQTTTNYHLKPSARKQRLVRSAHSKTARAASQGDCHFDRINLGTKRIWSLRVACLMGGTIIIQSAIV